MPHPQSEIAILDFGGQYVQNIQRNFLELGVHSEIMPWDTKASKLENFKGIVLSGGPYSLGEEGAPRFDSEILRLGVPVLGLCYGHQVLAQALGGEIEPGAKGEFGFSEVRVNLQSGLFENLSPTEIVWMSHNDKVANIPEAEVLASSAESEIAAFQKDTFYGLQFHPEVSHTPNGWRVLENFAFTICGCSRIHVDLKEFIDRAEKELKETIGDAEAILAVSGGVDSTVLASLAQKSIGSQLHAVHVDTGLMRTNESKEIMSFLKKQGMDVRLVEAEETFLNELQKAETSDEKRIIIGRLFVEEFEKVAREVNAEYLLQGTIAPDVIESTRGESAKKNKGKHGGLIKMHHNVAGLPSGMTLKVVEPLKTLFKYQVRELGRALDLPEEAWNRQPFPGPGLGVRISSVVTKDRADLLRGITELAEERLKPHGGAQYFAILMNAKYTKKDGFVELSERGIGVKGDERIIGQILGLQNIENKEWIDLLRLQNELLGKEKNACRVFMMLQERAAGEFGVILRSVDTKDFMTAIPTNIPKGELEKISIEILDKFTNVRWVGYEITTKPAGTIELL